MGQEEVGTPVETDDQAPPEAQEDEDQPASTDRATSHRERGIHLYLWGDFAAAAEELEQAQALVPEPDTLVALARCYEELGLLDHALGMLELYVAWPRVPPARRAQAEQMRLDMLQWLDPRDEEARVRPDLRRTSVERERSSRRRREPNPGELGYTMLMSGGACFALTGVILWIAAYSDYVSNQSLVGDGSATSGSYGIALAGDILVSLGAAALIGGLIWWGVERRRRRARTRERTAPTASGGNLLSSFP